MRTTKIAKDLLAGDIIDLGLEHNGDEIICSVAKSTDGVRIKTERGGDFSVSALTKFHVVGQDPKYARAAKDPINNPAHYTDHPSGAECIDIAEWFPFNLGCAIKYIWRAGKKGDRLEDLRKARWYVDREITRLEDAESRKDAGVEDPIITAWGKIDNA